MKPDYSDPNFKPDFGDLDEGAGLVMGIIAALGFSIVCFGCAAVVAWGAP